MRGVFENRILESSFYTFKIITLLILSLILFSSIVNAGINSTSPKQYDTLTQGKNQILKINHNYPSASIFWLINGNIVDSHNNKKEILFNTTKYIKDNSVINFDDHLVDVKIAVKVIDTTNPFNSDNYTWEFFVEPINYTFTTDKQEYYTGQTILLNFNAKRDTKLDISIFNSNNQLVMKYPTVTVESIKEFLIDSPDNPGTYKIVVDSKYYEYSKQITKTVIVKENTLMNLDKNFVKISFFPTMPGINDTVTIKAIMNNYDNLEIKWDLDGDGTYDDTGKEIFAEFDEEKEYIIKANIKNKQTLEEITRYETLEVGEEILILKLYVKNFFTKNEITNAKIIIDEREFNTNAIGEVTLDIKKGSYPLRIIHSDYNEYQQTLTIDSNYMQTIYLYKADEFDRAIKTDNRKPEVTLISPKKNEIRTNLLTTFEFNATDDVYLESCALYIKPKNAADWKQKIERNELGDKTTQKITVDLGFNTYQYKVICTDKKNNQASSETYEFSISQYATQTMYQDDIKKINTFIEIIDDAITNPKGDGNDEDLYLKMYSLFKVDENLVTLATNARRIKEDFATLIMNKESTSKISEKINEINQFMAEKSNKNIKRITILQKRQFLRSSTKERIKQTIDEMYQGLFDDGTLNILADNVFMKQNNLQIVTQILKIRITSLDESTKEQIVIINQISQKNLNENSIIYQLVPNELTTGQQNIIINKTFGEVTKSTDNNIIVTIIPETAGPEPFYIINENSDLSKINSLETIVIDNGDRTENIKKIVGKTNDVESLNEEEKPNILSNIENTKRTGLENIQGELITEFPTEININRTRNIIPYILMTIILGVMIGSVVVVFRGNNSSNDNEFHREIEFLQSEINAIQMRITKKIDKLIKDENEFISDVTENNKKEIELIEKTAKEITEEKNELVKKELINIQKKEIKKEHKEMKKQNIFEFDADEDENAKETISNFDLEIERLKKELF